MTLRDRGSREHARHPVTGSERELEAWAETIARRLVEALPKGCATFETQRFDKPRDDASAAITVTPRRSKAATIVLFVYASTRTLEVFVGRGLSFLFEGLSPADMAQADRDVMSLCRSVIAGHVTEQVTEADGCVVSITGVVETPSDLLSSGHVVGLQRDDATVRHIEYAPYGEDV
jgi:hypothetical protein